MNTLQNVILVAVMLTYAGIELITASHKNDHATADDGKLELFMFLSLLAILQPAIFAVIGKLASLCFPAYHGAHHAITNHDGIGHYKGNFGNLLFFWDVLFGTAHFTRRYPAQVGLRDDELFGKERWFTEMFYPLFKSRREYSALVPNGKIYDDSDDVKDLQPATVTQ